MSKVTRRLLVPGPIAAVVAALVVSLSVPVASGQESAPLPSDQRFPDQWALHNTGQTVARYNWNSNPTTPVPLTADADIDAPEGWALLKPATERRRVRVAIVAGGIDRTNPEFEGKVVKCAGTANGTGTVQEGACDDLDPQIGVTGLAGLIAAERDNTLGVAGIAPDVELAIFKFINDASRALPVDYYTGLEWAVTMSGADIIFIPKGQFTCAEDQTEKHWLAQAHAKGVLVVTEAGDRNCVAEGQPGPGDAPTYPAGYDFVLSVGGTDGRGQVWGRPFDNPAGQRGTTCNDTVDILAPAEMIWATDNTYGQALDPVNPRGSHTSPGTGTEFSAAIVTAVAALVMSQEDLTAAEVTERLIVTGTPVQPYRTQTGEAPRGDACAHLKQINLANALTAGLPLPVDIDVKPGSDDNRLQATASGVIPVALLGDDAFDASSVEVSSLRLGPGAAAPTGGVALDDLDGDGDTDLLVRFGLAATGLEPGETEACVTGVIRDGRKIHGCDNVEVRR